MDSNELLRKVRKIEIKTKGLSQNIFAGEYHSAFKGRGMTFSEVREYQYGDDIRDIDWNVTARHNRPYVKVYEEERELTVMLMVDVSGSKDFGAVGVLKRELMAELAATIAFSAIQNNDKVGVVFFSDRIEKFIPPKKGRKHILLVIRELLDFVYDKREAELPDVGLMRMMDSETGEERWINTGSKKTRQAYQKWWFERQQRMNITAQRCKVDVASMATDEDYVKSLMALFKKRGVR